MRFLSPEIVTIDAASGVRRSQNPGTIYLFGNGTSDTLGRAHDGAVLERALPQGIIPRIVYVTCFDEHDQGAFTHEGFVWADEVSGPEEDFGASTRSTGREGTAS